jgi:hypothetical protein
MVKAVNAKAGSANSVLFGLGCQLQVQLLQDRPYAVELPDAVAQQMFLLAAAGSRDAALVGGQYSCALGAKSQHKGLAIARHVGSLDEPTVGGGLARAAWRWFL